LRQVNIPLGRILLAVAALIQAGGGVVHALAFAKAETVLDNTNAPAFYVNSFKALWLGDSATLIAGSCILVCIIARPTLASRWVVGLLALFPVTTALLVYNFVGSFLPAHALAVAALLIMLAAYFHPVQAAAE
jgi:hypothetical protein